MLAQLTSLERESMMLFFARNAIEQMLNTGMDYREEEPGQFSVWPNDESTVELINIRLIDFLSPINHQGVESVPSLLAEMLRIAQQPSFDAKNIEYLQDAAFVMKDWIEQLVTFEDIWLPSINSNVTLEITRIEFLYICGNIGKHHPFRLNAVVRKLLDIFKRTNPSSTTDQAFLALEEFYQWFHQNIFYYHLTRICELLNNLNWGIQWYLEPTYCDVYKRRDEIEFEYIYPPAIDNQLVRYYFWKLMNTVRAKPKVQPFVTWKYLKVRY